MPLKGERVANAKEAKQLVKTIKRQMKLAEEKFAKFSKDKIVTNFSEKLRTL